jgi:hypothetical protein
MNAGITYDKTHNNYKVGLYVKEIGKYRYFTTANTEQEALELRNEMLSRKTKVYRESGALCEKTHDVGVYVVLDNKPVFGILNVDKLTILTSEGLKEIDFQGEAFLEKETVIKKLNGEKNLWS